MEQPSLPGATTAMAPHGVIMPLGSPPIAGLRYIPDLLDAAAERDLIAQIDASPWLPDLKRRVQHYGYKYDYKARRVDASMQLGALPAFILSLGARLVSDRIFDKLPDQAIVNEYVAGQGITPHVDCEPCFGETVASLSLVSAVTMDFDRPKAGEKRSIILGPRSLLVLDGEARHAWRHGIAPRVTDPAGFPRGRRISITFRTVVLTPAKRSSRSSR